MNKIKAAFFDIDGTLVSFRSHQVPPSACEAISRLRAAGIKVFIASGRHKKYINNLGNLEFDGFVTINGGITMVGNQVIDHHPIAPDNVGRFCQMLKENPLPCAMVTADEVTLNFRNQQVDEVFELLNFPPPPMGDLQLVANQNVYQFIAFFRNDIEAEIMQQLPQCSSARWHPLFSDVVPRGTSKVLGIQAIEKHFGFSRENVIAFGDGGNDIEMLQYAGIGIAMGNADDTVKAAANVVTSSVDDDGIYRFVVQNL